MRGFFNPPTEKENVLDVDMPVVKALLSMVISIYVELITVQVICLLVSIRLQVLTTREELDIVISEGKVKFR